MKKLLILFLSVTITFGTLFGTPLNNFEPIVSGFSIEASAEEADSYPLPYLANQLTKSEKNAYLEIRTNIIECRKKFSIKNLTEKQINKLFELAAYYDSYTFNMNGWIYIIRNGETEFLLTYTYSKKNYDTLIKNTDKKADAIIAKLDADMTQYAKIKYIYDYLSRNVTYSLTAKYNETAYGAIVKNTAKCDGLARAFTYICEKAGITVTNVTGDNDNSNDGKKWMWNKVRYNGKWYNVDVSNSKDGEQLYGSNVYRYFMTDDESYRTAYIETQGEIKIPEANDPGKSYYAVYKLRADSLDSAKSILQSELTKTFKNRHRSASIQCTSKSVYDSVMENLVNGDGVFNIMDTAAEKTGVKIVPTFIAAYDDSLYTVTIYCFYQNTKLSSYYTDTSGLSREDIDYFKKFGVK